MTWYAITSAVVIVGLLILLRPRRSSYLEHCELLTAKIQVSPLEGLEDFLTRASPPEKPGDFWAKSEGLRGIYERWKTAGILLRLCHVHLKDGRISPQDMSFIWERLSLQTWYSAWSIPEAVVCSFWRALPHTAARAALQNFGEISARTYTLLVTKDAPECVIVLGSVL